MYRAIVSERIGTIVLSALVAHTAWHWMIERGATVSRFTFEWPVLDASLAAKASSWGLLTLVALGMMWVLAAAWGLLGRR